MTGDTEEGLDLVNNDAGVVLLDRLSTTVSSPFKKDEFDCKKLTDYFTLTLSELKNLKEKVQKQTEKSETLCIAEEDAFQQRVSKLKTDMESIHNKFHALDKRISEVSRRTVHLGDQLERKNCPRVRLEEARVLILEFYKFLGAGGSTGVNTAFSSTNDENQLIEAASRIRKLSALCLELPDDERFLSAKQRVTVSCLSLDQALLTRFRYNFASNQTAVMRRINDAMTQSQYNSLCSDLYVEELLKTMPPNLGDLKKIPSGLEKAEKDVVEIFNRPDQVMSSLIHSFFTRKLKEHLQQHIPTPDKLKEEYIAALHREYMNVDNLVKETSMRLVSLSDPTQLSKLFRDLFASYLKDYIILEKAWLTNRLHGHLAQFYDSQKHYRRQIQSLQLTDIKRGMQAKLNISLDDVDRKAYEQVLVSQEVAINMLEDLRKSSKRCFTLSPPEKLAEHGECLFQIIIEALLHEHVFYGLTIGMQGIAMVDQKSPQPNFKFFQIVYECSAIIQFFDKSFKESIMPLINKSADYMQRCDDKRMIVKENIETKLNQGLDKLISISLTCIQNILSTNQKRTDFRPEMNGSSGANGFAAASSQPGSHACRLVCAFATAFIKEATNFLDGKNVLAFLHELGIRFNRVLIDHFYGYTYSDTGGFQAMQDMTVYREVARLMKSPMINYLFDVLLKLMNLLVIKADNLGQVSQDYMQSKIPRELVVNFIQLRCDYKSAHLQDQLKDLNR